MCSLPQLYSYAQGDKINWTHFLLLKKIIFFVVETINYNKT